MRAPRKTSSFAPADMSLPRGYRRPRNYGRFLAGVAIGLALAGIAAAVVEAIDDNSQIVQRTTTHHLTRK